MQDNARDTLRDSRGGCPGVGGSSIGQGLPRPSSSRPTRDPPLNGLSRFGSRPRAAAWREPAAPAVPGSASPPARPPRVATRRNLAWVAGSALLHLALLALVLFGLAPRREPSLDAIAPSFEVVYQGGQPERPAAEPPEGIPGPPAPPPPLGAAPSAPPPPAPPTPAAPPVVAAPAVPPPLVAPPEANQITPPPRPPAAAPQLPPPPPSIAALPEPPRPAPPVPPPPPAIAALPEPPRPAPPVPQPPSVTAPPPPQAAPTQQAARPPARPAPPAQRPPARLPPGTVFLPQGVPFGQRQGQGPSAAAPSGRPQTRGLDLSVDPRLLEGRATSDPNLNVSGAAVGADWRGAFRRWLDQNIRYPARAAELGESGQVRVRVVANADGTVRSVRIILPSGSPSLNVATSGPFAGARLPPFPPPVDPAGVTIDLTVNYILVRR
jgi:TonB family protein